jgi:hypothetical protein
MIKGDKTVTVINNHGEISPQFVRRLLRQWDISVAEWESV